MAMAGRLGLPEILGRVVRFFNFGYLAVEAELDLKFRIPEKSGTQNLGFRFGHSRTGTTPNIFNSQSTISTHGHNGKHLLVCSSSVCQMSSKA